MTLSMTTPTDRIQEFDVPDRDASFTEAADALAHRITQTGPSSDSASRDELEKCAWSVVEQWVIHRARADAKPLSETGNWTINPFEGRFLRAGYIDPAPYQDDLEECALEAFIDVGYAQDELRVGVLRCQTLVGRMISDYRNALGADDAAAEAAEAGQIAAELERVETEVAALMGKQLDLLQEKEDSRIVLEQQGTLNSILPKLAQIQHATRNGGLDANTRRVQMQVAQVERRLLNEIQNAIDPYDRRKRFEQNHAQAIEASVRLRDLQLELERATHATDEEPPLDKREKAARHAVMTARREANVVGKGRNDIPPFVLEHTPRLTLPVVEERLSTIDRVLKHSRPHFDKHPIEVLVVPGTGNCQYDMRSGRVVGAVFPIEVRMQSIIGAIGERILMELEELRVGYAREKKLSRTEEARLREEFRSDFAGYLESLERGTRIIEPGVYELLETLL